MAERTAGKPEISSQKRAIKLPPSIGDWTTYHPPQILIKKVKTGLYGFDRLSAEELDHALLIHYRFIEQLFQRFRTDLRLGIEFFSCQVEQTNYLNFLRTITEPVAQGKIKLEGFHDPVQLFFDLNLANSLINHALGSSDLEPVTRALTSAETIVLTTALNEYLPYYSQSFAQPSLGAEYLLVSSPDVTLDQSISPASTFVFFLAEVALNDNPAGKIIFGYPVALLKNLIRVYKEKIALVPLNFNRLNSAALNKITVPAKAILGTTILYMSELRSLEAGDVVSLETPINAPVTLSLGRLLILCQPGQLNKKKAVRLAGFEAEEKLELAPPLQIEEEEEGKGAGIGEGVGGIEEPREEPLEEEEEFKEEDLFPEDFEEEDLNDEEEKEGS